MCSTENPSFHIAFWIIYCVYTAILYVYTLVTVTKKTQVTVDARLYTQGENNTQKSCTVLIEGKDTHNCFLKKSEKRE